MEREQPENYQLVAQERERERLIKDAADARLLELDPEVRKEAETAWKETEAEAKGHRAKSESITIEKGFQLQLRDGITLVLTSDVKAEVLNAPSKEAIAGELAGYRELYGAVRESLAHDETEDLGDGRTVKRKITFGVGGAKTVQEEIVTTPKGKVNTTPVPGIDAAQTGNDATEARLAAKQNAEAKAKAKTQADADQKAENEQKLAKQANDAKAKTDKK